jgi:hypothetical protein
MKITIFGQRFNTDTMGTAQLGEVRRRLCQEVGRLEHAVDEAQARFGDGSDLNDSPLWFKRLCLALDRHRAALIQIESVLEDRSRRPLITLAESFMGVCAEKMPADSYAKVLAIAKKRAGQEAQP